MNNARKEFSEQTIVRIEAKIKLLLDFWVYENSTPEQDRCTSAAIASLTAARKVLLAELEEHE